jgi:hypothetical protein
MTIEEMVLEKFKLHLNDKMANAQFQLMLNDGFLPLFIYTTSKGVDEVEVDFEETSKDEAVEVMRERCKRPEVVACALLFCAYTLDQDLTDPKEKDRVLSENLKDEKDATESIMLYLYTKDKTEIRRISYSKRDDKKAGPVSNYWFGDDGWKDVTSTLDGRFSNPFKETTV